MLAIHATQVIQLGERGYSGLQSQADVAGGGPDYTDRLMLKDAVQPKKPEYCYFGWSRLHSQTAVIGVFQTIYADSHQTFELLVMQHRYAAITLCRTQCKLLLSSESQRTLYLAAVTGVVM